MCEVETKKKKKKKTKKTKKKTKEEDKGEDKRRRQKGGGNLCEGASEHDVKRGTEQISQVVPLCAIRVVSKVLSDLEGGLGDFRAMPGLRV